MQIAALHHVAVNVTDLERSRAFYRDTLGLTEIERPPFNFPGAWFLLGTSQHLHLIVHPGATFREGKKLDTRDTHFAVRVNDYWATAEFLQSRGYRIDAEDEFRRIIINPQATAGFPQMYIMDPDRHVIEINAAQLSPG
ncbi:MAG TPA: VOC family protein [Candidatus Sulfopaludibacter sp.]|jgi:catechol 2,3-dioxygenase-like lactoylglutathione lyase family enzyme|nr:VOC family protein [Candidatus Sulfopaludibacter sp.]